MDSLLRAEPLAPPGAPRLWRAGSLVYTTGGLAALFLWLLFGDFAWSLRDRSVGPLAQWYLGSLKVPNLFFGFLISSLPACISLILGPIISVRSDRHRGRLGRRIPFLLLTTPLAALAMIGLGLTPALATAIHATFRAGQPAALFLQERAWAGILPLLQDQVAISVICFAISWAVFEVATVIAQAVFGGLINDVVPRPLLGRFFGLFRAVSLIDGMIFNFWIMGKAPAYFTVILVAVGLFYGAAFWLVCRNVKEGKLPPPPPGQSTVHPLVKALRETKGYLRESFAEPRFLAIFLMMAAASMAFVPVNTFAIRYSHSLGIDMDTYGKFLALTYLISLGLSFFLGWLADAFHPLRMAMVTLLGYVLVTFWGAFYAITPASFLTAWVLHGVLSGSYMTTAASLGQRLFPQARYAQFASAAGIVGALVHIVLAPVTGKIIDATGESYRYVFLVGGALARLSLGAAWLVYARYRALDEAPQLDFP